jgi:hypothetical protein
MSPRPNSPWVGSFGFAGSAVRDRFFRPVSSNKVEFEHFDTQVLHCGPTFVHNCLTMNPETQKRYAGHTCMCCCCCVRVSSGT